MSPLSSSLFSLSSSSNQRSISGGAGPDPCWAELRQAVPDGARCAATWCRGEPGRRAVRSGAGPRRAVRGGALRRARSQAQATASRTRCRPPPGAQPSAGRRGPASRCREPSAGGAGSVSARMVAAAAVDGCGPERHVLAGRRQQQLGSARGRQARR